MKEDENEKFIAVFLSLVIILSLTGSADSTIKNAVANDLSVILENSRVDKIFVNGKTAEKYYIKYIEPKLNIKAVCLPSTSPANASYNIEKLCEAWKKITEYLKY